VHDGPQERFAALQLLLACCALLPEYEPYPLCLVSEQVQLQS
jgi:hypothetical protein